VGADVLGGRGNANDRSRTLDGHPAPPDDLPSIQRVNQDGAHALRLPVLLTSRIRDETAVQLRRDRIVGAELEEEFRDEEQNGKWFLMPHHDADRALAVEEAPDLPGVLVLALVLEPVGRGGGERARLVAVAELLADAARRLERFGPV